MTMDGCHSPLSVPPSIKNNSELKYTLTVINNGDSPATKVTLTDTADTINLEIHDASLPYTRNETGSLVWQLPDLAPGKATEITYYGRVKSNEYSTDITNTVTVQARETDNDRLDNTDTITVTTDARSHSGSRSRLHLSSVAGASSVVSATANSSSTEKDIDLLRLTTASTVNVKKNGTITQRLVLKNNTTHTISGVVVHDRLKDPLGVLVRNEPWELGDILPKEEINISYDITFPATARTGLYTFDTQVVTASGMNKNFAGNGSIIVSSVDAVLDIQPSPLQALLGGLMNSELSTDPFWATTSSDTGVGTSTGTSSLLALDVPGNQQALVIAAAGIPFRYSLYGLLLVLLALAGIRYFVRTVSTVQRATLM